MLNVLVLFAFAVVGISSAGGDRDPNSRVTRSSHKDFLGD